MTKTQFIIGYARVSTVQQDVARQVKALQDAGAHEVVIDHGISGAHNTQSPKFKYMLSRVDDLIAEGHEVSIVVKSLDRFSRSVVDLLSNLESLSAKGIHFRTLDGSLQYRPGNAQDKLFIGNLALIVEFERSLIQGRTESGRELAVERGLLLGPRPKFTAVQVDLIRKDSLENRKTDRQLAKDWQCSRSTIQRILGLYDTKPYVTREEWDEAKFKARSSLTKDRASQR